MDCYGDAPRPTLNIYYLAEPIGGEEHPASDATQLGWFSWDNLPEQIAFAHARGVLDDWRAKELELISI
jgi:hypothetical protein